MNFCMVLFLGVGACQDLYCYRVSKYYLWANTILLLVLLPLMRWTSGAGLGAVWFLRLLLRYVLGNLVGILIHRFLRMGAADLKVMALMYTLLGFQTAAWIFLYGLLLAAGYGLMHWKFCGDRRIPVLVPLYFAAFWKLICLGNI